MTPKQTERLKKKITDIKRALAAEKRKLGCYDDSRGRRYMPLRYFIKLSDYAGGLAYLKWFQKNFPDDGGFPEFLFEWTIILFKTGKIKEAEKKAFQTFCRNPYWFDKFFGKPIKPIDMWHGSNIAAPEYAEALAYSNEQADPADFCEWLEKTISTDEFVDQRAKHIEIYRRLKSN
ncbi:MAG TPA: hypothetical protein PK339_10600 [Flavitalea sp.]|mgnify:CR=1 FL=1|nr:hypothetical protein [Flavitalea sp.]